MQYDKLVGTIGRQSPLLTMSRVRSVSELDNSKPAAGLNPRPSKKAKAEVPFLPGLENLPDNVLLRLLSFLPHLTSAALTSRRLELLLSNRLPRPNDEDNNPCCYPCCDRGDWCHENLGFLRTTTLGQVICGPVARTLSWILDVAM